MVLHRGAQPLSKTIKNTHFYIRCASDQKIHEIRNKALEDTCNATRQEIDEQHHSWIDRPMRELRMWWNTFQHENFQAQAKDHNEHSQARTRQQDVRNMIPRQQLQI